MATNVALWLVVIYNSKQDCMVRMITIMLTHDNNNNTIIIHGHVPAKVADQYLRVADQYLRVASKLIFYP